MTTKNSRETLDTEDSSERKTLEPRPPWSEAGRSARSPPSYGETKGPGSQRGGARQNPERRGTSRGGGSRSR